MVPGDALASLALVLHGACLSPGRGTVLAAPCRAFGLSGDGGMWCWEGRMGQLGWGEDFVWFQEGGMQQNKGRALTPCPAALLQVPAAAPSSGLSPHNPGLTCEQRQLPAAPGAPAFLLGRVLTAPSSPPSMSRLFRAVEAGGRPGVPGGFARAGAAFARSSGAQRCPWGGGTQPCAVTPPSLAVTKTGRGYFEHGAARGWTPELAGRGCVGLAGAGLWWPNTAGH